MASSVQLSQDFVGSRQHRADSKTVGALVQLVLFIGFVAFWIPSVRQLFLKLGVIFMLVAILAFVVALGVYLIRRSERRSPFSADGSTTLDVTTSVPQRRELTSAVLVADRVRPATTDDLIEQLRAVDWFQFEKFVASVYRKLGYVVTRRGGAKPDGGIDLLIEKGGQRTAVQCKQWKTWNVGVKSIREFLGALTDSGISNGIFITLRGYTGDAKQLAEKHRIEIVDETGLARMLESTDAKCDPEVLSVLNDQRKFCPKCESLMLLRTTRKGLRAGSKFWGCSTYPRCRFTIPA
jgi:hypothetical protein